MNGVINDEYINEYNITSEDINSFDKF